ncbi:MAG: prolyl oligopeptidase family serine peptidase [Gemmatimonadaceae bacterium]
MFRHLRVLSAALLLLFPGAAASAQGVVQTGAAPAAANAKPADPKVRRALSIDDYSKWRTVGDEQISPDGKWVAYVMRFTNVPTADAKPELHIKRLDTMQDTVIHYATAPRFSSDSRWVTYQIELPPPRRDSTRRAPPRDSTPADTTATVTAGASRTRADTTPPPRRRTELRELATGSTKFWQDIQTAEFSPTATHLLMHRRPPQAGGAGGAGGGAASAGGGGGGAAAGSPAASMRGRDALLHDLATERTVLLGSVGEAEFNRVGTLLAYTVEATVKDGNGLFAVDLATGRTHVLDNDKLTYSRLAWNDAGTAVAALKAKEVPRMRERDKVLLVYPNVRAVFGTAATAAAAKPVTLDTTAAGFPKGFVISDRAALSWSDDNRRVFFGIIARTPAPDTTRPRSTDSTANVDVWRTDDERVQSVQMIRANAERNFTFRQAFDVAVPGGRFIALSDSTLRDLEVAPDGRWAVGRDARTYVVDHGLQRADFYRVNTMTGERTLMLREHVLSNGVFGISSDGRHYLYWKDEKFHDYNLDAGTSRVLGGAQAPSFASQEWEFPTPKPSYGIAGYSADGRGAIVNHRYDLWLLPYDGSAARELTRGEGSRNEMRLRVTRTVPVDPMSPRAARDQRVVDLAKPVTLSAFGEITKKNGYYELAGNTLRSIVYDDAMFTTPERALKADRYLFTRQTFAEYPDLRVSGAAFGNATKITQANPQQDDFIWGRRVLFDFQLKDGKTMQGMIALPDDYKDFERRPMIVSFYERQTAGLNRHTPPSFLGGMGSIPIEAVSRGYVAMIPDVHFRTGSSHSDMLEAVEAATRKVIALGYADSAKVAVHGHSYGGEGAAFIATQSKLFAAVGMGAGVTDLTSDFSQNWGWSYQVNSGSGATGYDYYLNGQGRWGKSPWEDPELYRRESALPNAPNVSMPVLIMHGTADPTVAFSEGLNFYNALRFNKKTAYLLAYPNEGHGLRGVANRKDLTIRYMQFFDHYLKGAPAPKWMTDGVPFLVKETIKEPR